MVQGFPYYIKWKNIQKFITFEPVDRFWFCKKLWASKNVFEVNKESKQMDLSSLIFARTSSLPFEIVVWIYADTFDNNLEINGLTKYLNGHF